LDLLQKKLNIFLSYDVNRQDQQVDCFENKEINFSISWFPSVQTYYTEYMQKRIKVMKGLKEASDESLEEEAKDMMNHPCFILAHELFDALPVH
jgi:hypothetical protein